MKDVIPAKAGIHIWRVSVMKTWIPAFAGMTYLIATQSQAVRYDAFTQPNPLKYTAALLDCSNKANSVFSLTLTLDTKGLNGTLLHL